MVWGEYWRLAALRGIIFCDATLTPGQITTLYRRLERVSQQVEEIRILFHSPEGCQSPVERIP
jgi:hypothetical protein